MGAKDGERESSQAEERSNAGSRGRIPTDVWRSVPVSLQLLCFQEHVANRDNIRVREQEEQKAEEERRQLFLSAKDKMMKLRKDREVELLRCNLARQPRPLNSVVHQLNNFTQAFFFYPEKPRSTEKAS